jgi:hypothetical protein
MMGHQISNLIEDCLKCVIVFSVICRQSETAEFDMTIFGDQSVIGP